MAKRFLALLLSCLMLLTLCPATLAAEDATETDMAKTEAEVTAPRLGSALARDYVRSIQIDLTEPVELTEGLDGYWRTGYDEHYEEYRWFSYRLDSIGNNAQYTVTFTEAGAERYNNGELTFTGWGYELERLFSDLEDPYISYQPTMPQDMIHWETGTTHTVRLKFLDVVWQEIAVSAVPNPVESIEFVASGPMELIEGIDGYQATRWDENNKQHVFFRYDVDHYGGLQYTVTFSESGAQKYGMPSFTGTRWEIAELMDTGLYWDDDQYETPWQVGETYQAELWFMNQKWQTASVKILPNPVKSIELAVPGPIELIEGIDGYQSSYWDENDERHEFFRYNVDRYSELPYTVTFSESGAEKYGVPSFTGTQWEIEELLGVMPDWNDNQYETPWQVGGTYEAHLWFMERQWQTVQVTIVSSPVVKITAKLPDLITLAEGIDGYQRSYRDETGEEHESFYYDVDYHSDVQYTVTFSKSGAEKYNQGKTTFTGTQWEIEDLLGVCPGWDDDQYDTPWQVGGTYEARLQFMGETWQTVSVKILPSPVKSISSDMPKAVTLWENHSGYGGDGRFHYDVEYESDANYTITFTAEGAKKYNQGKTTFTGNRVQVGELIGVWPQWDDDQYENPWQVGKTYTSQLRFMGKTWQTVQVTIAVSKLPALPAATELTWGKEYRPWDEKNPVLDHPGFISWRRDASVSAEYEVTVYRKNPFGSDTVLSQFRMDYPALQSQQAEPESFDIFCQSDPTTGDYYFTVKTMGDYIRYQDSPTAVSGIYHYVQPEAKLPRLDTFRIKGNTFNWAGTAPQKGSSSVAIGVYFSKTQDGKFSMVTEYGGIDYHAINGASGVGGWFDKVTSRNGSGYYYLRLRALTDNIEQWQSGNWSDPSPALYVTGETEPEPEYDPRDLNMDGAVNVLDLQALYDLLATGTVPKAGEALCDINGDGMVNILDYQALYKLVQKPAHGGTSVVVESSRTGAPAAEA